MDFDVLNSIYLLSIAFYCLKFLESGLVTTPYSGYGIRHFQSKGPIIYTTEYTILRALGRVENLHDRHFALPSLRGRGRIRKDTL